MLPVMQLRRERLSFDPCAVLVPMRSVRSSGPWVALAFVAACSAGQRPSPDAGRLARLPAADSTARVAWLGAHASPLRTLDPADTSFDDLAPVGRAIGDARIVFLGEAAHGEGGAYLGKTRLVIYLHEKLGFDALVFEGGFYEGSKVWSALIGGAKPADALILGVPPAWSWSGEIEPLAEYLAAQARGPRPLRFMGYDPQSGYPTSRASLPLELRAFLDSVGLRGTAGPDSSFWRGLGWILRSLSPADSLITDSAAVERFVETTRRLRADLARRPPSESTRFWQQVLESTGAYARQLRQTRVEIETKDTHAWTSSNTRDEQGARNLLWLANDRFRGHRLIVWSATIHAARHVRGVDTRDSAWSYAGYIPTGEHVWRSLGTRMYALGFVGLGGGWRLGTTDSGRIRVDQHPAAELEELIGAAGFDFAFLDFRRIARGGEWLREPLLSRPFAEHAKIARWPDVLDGIVFVREMQPATWPNFEARLRGSRPLNFH